MHRIFERVTGLAEQYLPDEVALRGSIFGKNVQSMLKLGRAQGCGDGRRAMPRDIPIAEYAPRLIKWPSPATGRRFQGAGVANMLRHLLDIPEDRIPKMLDATDALAVALTHYYETGKPSVAKRSFLVEGFSCQKPGPDSETPRVIDTLFS